MFKGSIGVDAGERESPPPSIHEHPRTKGFKDFLWAGWLAEARMESGRRRALVLEDGGGPRRWQWLGLWSCVSGKGLEMIMVGNIYAV